MIRAPRLAVRAVLLHENRLLLVNAYKGRTDLWCAPGGGVEPHASLPDNLRREMMEETGLDVAVTSLECRIAQEVPVNLPAACIGCHVFNCLVSTNGCVKGVPTATTHARHTLF